MSSKRDSLLLSGSSGRANVSIVRTASHESLTAHPLLSPTPSISSADTPSSTAPSTAPKYVPYTPRQRVAPTSATTGTTVHPNVTPHQHPLQGDATSKLHLLNLKAAAQKVGLDTASTGWAILERLGGETDHSAEWNEIWNAITTAKVTLLLPVEPHPSSETISAEFIKDHIALCEGPSRDNIQIVTLSGLRGVLNDETLTIRSSLPTTSKTFQALLSPATRASALSALPPLPSPLASDPSPPTYPSFAVPSYTPALPLLPRPVVQKPPLPPRPGASRPSTQSPGYSSPIPTRVLSNPFASLFGRSTASPPSPASPVTGPLPLHPDVPGSSASVSSSPATSHLSFAMDAEHPLEVAAFTLSARIHRPTIAKAISRTLRTELRAALWRARVPAWAQERTDTFVAKLYPLVRVPGASKWRPKPEKDTKEDKGEWVISSGWLGDDDKEERDPEEMARQFQEFYVALEEEARRRPRSIARLSPVIRTTSPSVVGTASPPLNGSGSGDEADEKDLERDAGTDDKIREMIEAVESTVCSLFYDRLFSPSESDDASHDEAVSSRIAAVNLLDLGLGHLGVEVGNSGPEVEAVVKACGETLVRLDSVCRSPAEKAAMLIAAHKIIVDGLSRLPPIGLKPEGDDDYLDDKTPRAATFGRHSTEDSDEEELSEITTHKDFIPPLDTQSPAVILSSESTGAQELLVASPVGDTSPANTGLHSPTDIAPRASSPIVAHPPPSSSTPVSGDIILPLMIFAAVKTNPPRLVSHLLYTQRFRNQFASSGGEEGYCLINLMAVAEFLENVDLAALGLGDSERTVISTAELTPIPVTRSALSESTSGRISQASLRGRVEQQVDAIAGSANKVISGVVDTSFGVLRSFLPGTPAEPHADGSAGDDPPSRPTFGLLRRDTGFSIASLAASLPGSRAKPSGQDEESGQQLIEVPSRPGSRRQSIASAKEAGLAATDSSSEADEEEEDEEGEEEEEGEYDTRSIRSFESMMSSRSKSRQRQRQKAAAAAGRKSLTDRLASMPGLSRLGHAHPQEASKPSPPDSRRSSLLPPRADSPVSSRDTSPSTIRVPPPNPRFLTCTEDDLKVAEVGELLREYKRLAEAVRAMGGFNEV